MTMTMPNQQDLTRDDALDLAKARWGVCGGVWYIGSVGMYAVGRRTSPKSKWIRFHGRGDTWREACERAGLLARAADLTRWPAFGVAVIQPTRGRTAE